MDGDGGGVRQVGSDFCGQRFARVLIWKKKHARELEYTACLTWEPQSLGVCKMLWVMTDLTVAAKGQQHIGIGATISVGILRGDRDTRLSPAFHLTAGPSVEKCHQ